MKKQQHQLEVLFKCVLDTEASNDVEIHTLLKDTIKGLDVKAVEVYPGRIRMKAVVTANILELLQEARPVDVEDGVVASASNAAPARAKGDGASDISSREERETANRRTEELMQLKEELENQMQMNSYLKLALMQKESEIQEIQCEKQALQVTIAELTSALKSQSVPVDLSLPEGATADANTIRSLEARLHAKESAFEECKAEFEARVQELAMELMTTQAGQIEAVKKAKEAEAVVDNLREQNEELQNQEKQLVCKITLLDGEISQLKTVNSAQAADLAQLTRANQLLHFQLEEANRNPDSLERVRGTQSAVEIVNEGLGCVSVSGMASPLLLQGQLHAKSEGSREALKDLKVREEGISDSPDKALGTGPPRYPQERKEGSDSSAPASMREAMEATRNEMAQLQLECIKLKKALVQSTESAGMLNVVLRAKTLMDEKRMDMQTALQEAAKQLAQGSEAATAVGDINDTTKSSVLLGKLAQFLGAASDSKEKKLHRLMTVAQSLEVAYTEDKKRELLKSVAQDLSFLQTIECTSSNLPLLLSCVRAIVQAKSSKKERYCAQVKKFRMLAEFANAKLAVGHQ